LLAAGERKPSALFEHARTRFVTAQDLANADPDLKTLQNLNTPEVYEAALREIEDHGSSAYNGPA